MALKLRRILAGIRRGRAGNERQTLVNGPALRVIERAQHEPAVGRIGEGFAGDGRVIPFFLVWKLKNEQTGEPKGDKPMVEINAYSKAKDGGKKLSAKTTISTGMSNWKKDYSDVRIIDSSASGLWEKESCNLLELL